MTAGLIVFYPQVFTCFNPHDDRCADPLPWDPLSSPYRGVAALRGVEREYLAPALDPLGPLAHYMSGPDPRGNHLSDTTCLTQVFFKSAE